jgi:uncharacterized membrane protein YoaK (UPF0700 family)
MQSTRSVSPEPAARGEWLPTAAARRRALALPFVLSVLAGATDIISFLGFNGLFTAHITGNLVILAAKIVAGNPTIISHILAIPVFMVVLFLTSLLAETIERHGGSRLRPLLLLELLMLTAFLVLGVVNPSRDPDAVLAIAAGMFGVAAMAVQNALVKISLSDTPSTTVMTTNVTHLIVDCGTMLIGRHAAQRDKAKDRALKALQVVVGFAVGCCLGAAAEVATGAWSLALPTGLALLALALTVGNDTRSAEL